MLKYIEPEIALTLASEGLITLLSGDDYILVRNFRCTGYHFGCWRMEDGREKMFVLRKAVFVRQSAKAILFQQLRRESELPKETST
ncbi:MAG: hypothetical protein Q4D62_11410 [Planctomycetia bacterium]|nr:hypothetical protein [Planctomycetia bacterium]